MTDAQLSKMTTDEQKAAARVLTRMGWGTRKIEQWLIQAVGEDEAIDHNTVWRAKEQEAPEDMRQFETDFELAITDAKKQGLAMTISRILEVVPTSKKLGDLVRAAEYLENKQSDQKPGVAVQINIGDARKYVEE